MADTEADTIRTIAPPGVSFRRVTDADLPFLAEVYASTRREELDFVPWSAEEKESFLRSQFELQDRHYHEHYPGCEFLIVEKKAGARSEPIGRLYVDRWQDQIRIVDIALLPAHRGGGLGAALVREVLAEAQARALPVTIHVEGQNRALGLYRRLGFEHIDTHGVYYLMRWSP